MQAVLCLIEDLVGMFLEDFLGDLLSAVCRETVLDIAPALRLRGAVC